jgi:hypothetical protein
MSSEPGTFPCAGVHGLPLGWHRTADVTGLWQVQIRLRPEGSTQAGATFSRDALKSSKIVPLAERSAGWQVRQAPTKRRRSISWAVSGRVSDRVELGRSSSARPVEASKGIHASAGRPSERVSYSGAKLHDPFGSSESTPRPNPIARGSRWHETQVRPSDEVVCGTAAA